VAQAANKGVKEKLRQAQMDREDGSRRAPRRRYARTANRREALSAALHVFVELTAGDEVALPKMGDHVPHCLVPRILVIGRPCGRCSFG
jgi:hypothetical protein